MGKLRLIRWPWLTFATNALFRILRPTEEILLTEGDSEDRPEGLRRVMSQFQPNAVIDMAYRAEKLLPRELQGTPV